MCKPSFIIFAGCNGSGKSTYSKLLSNGVDAFDYDKTYLNYYNNMRDSELREQLTLNKTTEDFERIIESSFEKTKSIAFETNFNNVPQGWLQRANYLGYKITIFFFVLDTIDKAHFEISQVVEFPHYLNHRLPKIVDLIISSNNN